MDKDEEVGDKLNRIRAAQAAVMAEDSSEDEDEDDDDDGVERRWQEAKLLHASSQERFLQSPTGSSQPLVLTSPPPLSTIDYRPPTIDYYARHPNNSTTSVPFYQIDPLSPWAPGGCMAPGGSQYMPPPTLLAAKPPQAPRPSSSSRATSPASRASSPASAAPSSGTKKKLAKAKRKDPHEEEKLNREIDLVINHFTPEYKHKITCEEERDSKNVDDQELYNVARWLNINKPVPRKLDLAAFSSKQIRKLALKCGVKGGGNLTLFQCRRRIAMSITMGTVYNDNTISNPMTTTAERKVNTLMRILNACFHSDMRDKFIDLNDAKKRADYERAQGGNPVKDFWVQISEFTNDTTRNDVLGVVLESRDDEDEHLKEFVADGAFNLNDFTLQTYISCQQNVSDCMKARENCLKAMRMSGHHSNDLWTYCGNHSFTKLRKASPPVPAKAVYYCHVLCTKHPDIDGKFATFLSENLKSDSDVDLSGSADCPKDNSRSKSKALETLVQSIASATTEMTSFFAEKKQQQQQKQQHEGNLVTVEEEARKRTLWAEYLDLASKFLEMKEDPSKLPLLSNFAIRIRELETLCGIPQQQSVTNGITGIPAVVFATVGGTPSTSDVTSNK